MLKSMEEAYEANRLVNHQIIITLGPTPPILIQIGLEQLPITITGKVIDKSFYDHGVKKSLLERAYQIIAVPKALYCSKTIGYLVMSYEIKGADPLIIALHPNKQVGGRKDFYNNVASIYYKENNPEIRWKNEGLLIWHAPPK
jgi:hypothetical protein